ncbi:MAG TPA: autoinducer binding domain-containing protein [Devosia sp.]|nr:autoinducer binding domain-containing protein [Devosia sp.]
MAMPGHLFSRLESIQKADSGDALSDAVELAVSDFGGMAFAVGVIPRRETPLVWQERGLQRWIDYYHQSGLFQGCAFSRRTSTTLLPFTWDEEMESEPEETRQVASAAQGYGVCHGLQVPVVTRHGAHGGIFIQTEQGMLSAETRYALVAVALAAHSRLEALSDTLGQTIETLSVREREVLSWFAEGKSAEDVGRILDISPATVMYHYRAVADRYGTLNRTHTIIEAMRRGALRLLS